MRFANVNDPEVRILLVLLIQLFELADLRAKRRSGVAAKNENRRPLPVVIPELKSLVLADDLQRKVNRVLPRFRASSHALGQRQAQTRNQHQSGN